MLVLKQKKGATAQMTMNKSHPLADWLDTLPEPKTVEEIALCAYSDAIDEIAMALAKFRLWLVNSRK